MIHSFTDPANRRGRMHPIAKVCIILAIVFFVCAIVATIGLASWSARMTREILWGAKFLDVPEFSKSAVARMLDQFENIGDAFDNGFDHMTSESWNTTDTTGLTDGGFTSIIKAEQVSAIESIDLSLVVGSVTIRPASDGQITIRYNAHMSSNTSRKHSYSYDDGIVSETGVISFEQKFSNRPSQWFRNDRNRFALEIDLPATAVLAIRVDSVVGDIDLDLARCNDVRITNVNGDIRAQADTATSITANNVNGSIYLTDRKSELPEMNAGTVNGDIEFGIAPGAAFSVHASTINGRVRVDDTDHGRVFEREIGGGSLRLESINGSLTVTSE